MYEKVYVFAQYVCFLYTEYKLEGVSIVTSLPQWRNAKIAKQYLKMRTLGLIHDWRFRTDPWLGLSDWSMIGNIELIHDWRFRTGTWLTIPDWSVIGTFGLIHDWQYQTDLCLAISDWSMIGNIRPWSFFGNIGLAHDWQYRTKWYPCQELYPILMKYT